MIISEFQSDTDYDNINLLKKSLNVFPLCNLYFYALWGLVPFLTRNLIGGKIYNNSCQRHRKHINPHDVTLNFVRYMILLIRFDTD